MSQKTEEKPNQQAGWGTFAEKWTGRFRAEPPVRETPPPSGRAAVYYFVLLLKVLVPITVAGYILSLLWDFTGTVTLPWSGETVPLSGLLRMFTVSALIGYGTNWVAVKMLFYPRKKRPLFGQGLIPSRKNDIVVRLADAISDEIINARLIVEQVRKSGLISKHRQKWHATMNEVLSEAEFRAELAELVRTTVIQFLRSEDAQKTLKQFVSNIDFEKRSFMEGGLLKLFRMVSGDKEIIVRLNEMIESVTLKIDPNEEQWNRLLRTIPDKMNENSQEIEEFLLRAVVFLIEHIDVRSVVLDNLKEFDEVRLERLLMRSTSEQLEYIQYLGCFLGYIGGLFIWRPVESIVFFGAAGVILWSMDMLLFRMIEKRRSRTARHSPRT
jgi:uncharacterized membrane protein YheB (UPF0754 family)